MTELKFPDRLNAATVFVDSHLAEGRADKPAILCGDDIVTYRQLSENINRFGNALLELGVRMEERVAILMPDTPECVYAFFGAMKIGAASIPINTILQPENYEYMLNDSRARVLVVHSSLIPKIMEVRGQLNYIEHIVVAGDEAKAPLGMSDLMAKASPELEPADTSKDDTAFWLYSSGTTGFPKGTVHLHHDMIVEADLYARDTIGVKEDDISFSIAKLFFAYGLGNGLYFPLRTGGTTVLLPGRCGDVVDLCIERGTKVPVDRDALSVRIPLHLGPGKGVVFSLGKWQRLTAQDGRKLHERLEAERQDRAAVLLRKIEAPAADPALAARRRTALAVARMAAKAADFGLVEHYARQGDALPPGSATTAVPRQSSPPRIDGDVSEWPPAHWHALPATRAVVGKADNGRDLSARFALCRVDQSVFLAVTVRDDVVRNEQPPATLWQEDGLEVFFDFMADGDATAGKYGYDDFQFFLGVNGLQHTQTKLPSAPADFAVRKTADGYAIEAAFRLDALGVTVAKGTVIGFDLSIDDADTPGHRECQLAWRGTARNWLDTRTLARVVFR